MSLSSYEKILETESIQLREESNRLARELSASKKELSASKKEERRLRLALMNALEHLQIVTDNYMLMTDRSYPHTRIAMNHIQAALVREDGTALPEKK